MGERKVLNKYYPPDFDPNKIPKRKQLKNLQMKVRMMLPMSIRCNTCGTYMYKGTKFNCRKEDVVGDVYLGLLKFRFYFKCTKCSAEMVMKTDPKNSDYEMEAGASRNFEPWREADEVRDAAKKQREEEEMGDAMKALENRTKDSRVEMDILASLDEVKSLRARQAQLDPAQVLQALRGGGGEAGAQGGGQGGEGGGLKSEEQLAEEDEAVIRSIVFRNSADFVKRIEEEEEEEWDEEEEEGEEEEGGEKSAGGGDLSKKTKRVKQEKGEERQGEDGAGVERGSSRASRVAPSAFVTLGTPLPKVGAGMLPGGIPVAPDLDKPSFEVRPVNVAFAVREKSRRSAAAPPPHPAPHRTPAPSAAPRPGLASALAPPPALASGPTRPRAPALSPAPSSGARGAGSVSPPAEQPNCAQDKQQQHSQGGNGQRGAWAGGGAAAAGGASLSMLVGCYPDSDDSQ